MGNGEEDGMVFKLSGLLLSPPVDALHDTF
jgi:hypothetical protein